MHDTLIRQPTAEVRLETFSDRDELARTAQRAAEGASEELIVLAFALDELNRSGWIASTGHRNFSSWWRAEMGGYLPLATAARTLMVGQYFRKWRDEILRDRKEIGYELLAALVARIRSGVLTSEEAMELVRARTRTDALPPLRSPVDSGLTEIRFMAERALLFDILSGMIRHAVRNQISSIDEAVVHLAIGETLDPSLPEAFERWRPLIESGRFFCMLCGKVPMQPTVHHVIPRSIGMGSGPKVLLCWEPCHSRIVQPRWRHYAKLWGYNVDELIKNLDRTLEKTGVLDEEDMSAVRTGRPAKWKRIL